MGSKDCFRVVGGFDDFCTLNATFVGEGRSGIIDDPPAGSIAPLEAALGAGEPVPQPHVCFLGIAAVTLPQPQACCGGCGQTLRGLPGFLTGTISLSLECVHFVDRWPRIQGSLGREVS